jgi:hypothetical protein
VGSSQLEGTIQGGGYYAVWRRNDRPWGHAIDATVFHSNGNSIGSVSFACHPEFADYKRYQQMPTDELVQVVGERLRSAMQDDSYMKSWRLGFSVLVRFNGIEQRVPNTQ